MRSVTSSAVSESAPPLPCDDESSESFSSGRSEPPPEVWISSRAIRHCSRTACKVSLFTRTWSVRLLPPVRWSEAEGFESEASTSIDVCRALEISVLFRHLHGFWVSFLSFFLFGFCFLASAASDFLATFSRPRRGCLVGFGLS